MGRNTTSAKGKIIANYDQIEHMVEGTPVRDFGVGPWPQPDPVDVPNPFDFAIPGDGNFDGQSNAVIDMENKGQTVGLQSDRADLGQSMINMDVANNCFDEPSKGGLAYGPKNTGENYG